MSELGLGEYVDLLRHRHSRLSMRKMSIQAGLGPSAVKRIIKGLVRPSPWRLKALADRWGTAEDYREMMRLAGHPSPDPIDEVAVERIAAHWGLSPDLVRAVAEGRTVYRETGGEEMPVLETRATYPEFHVATRDIPDEVLERLLRFALFERQQLEEEPPGE